MTAHNLHDDHDDFGGLHRDLLATGAAMDRRRMLRLAARFGMGAGALQLLGCGGSSSPTSPTDTGTGTTTNLARAEFYKIKAGDTLAVVAEQYDTTVEQLMVLNPDVDPVALTIGQRIRVK